MGRITVNSKSVSTNAKYENENVRIDFTHQKDMLTGKLTDINGNVFDLEGKTRKGYFSGRLNGDDIEYTFHGFKSLDAQELAVAAVKDIVEQIAETESAEE